MANGGQDGRHPFRVHVSGLAKGVVHRQEGNECYDEEYEVGDFFHNRGCEVVWVSLLVDKRSNRSRGFAFVDLEDEDSFRKACALDGVEHPTEVKLDEKSGGKIHVSPAKPSDESIRERQLELSKERDRTDGLEKDLRLVAARINEKMEQIQTQRERQMSLQRNARVEEELQNQRARQQQIKELMAELESMETNLSRELRAERERTRALEELHASVLLPMEEHDDSSGQHAVAAAARCFKPRIAPEAEHLHRSISASHRRRASSPHSSPQHSSSQPRPASNRPWLAKRTEKQEAMHRAASVGHADISRNILDGKIQALEQATIQQDATRATPSAPAAPKKKGPTRPRWGEISDGDDDEDLATAGESVIWGRGCSRKDVLVKKLPLLPDDELKAGLERELARLWEALHKAGPPRVESVDITARPEIGAAEAIVTFAEAYDAWLLVERCGAPDWAAATPAIHGCLLQIEWPSAPPRQPAPDLRKFLFRADSDASSHMSYNTTGTAHSRSSLMARHAPAAKAARPAPDAGASAEGKGAAGESSIPLQNRTIILSGVPTMMKIYDVQDEILRLLQRLYQREGLSFKPEVQLHKGRQGLDAGLEVRPPATRTEENGGSVKLRLRSYADAVWLVEQASGLKIAGSKLKASWAAPKLGGGGGGNKGGGGGGKGPGGGGEAKGPGGGYGAQGARGGKGGEGSWKGGGGGAGNGAAAPAPAGSGGCKAGGRGGY